MGISTSVLKDAGATLALIKTYLGTDEHANEEPVHDDARDLDAVDFNKLVAGLAEVAKRLRPGNLVPVEFELATTPQNTTTAVPLAGSALTKWLAFKDGRVVGITAYFETALSAGQAIVHPKINGTNCALALTIAATAQAGRAYQLPADAAAGDALDASALLGAELECAVTTSGAFACSASSKLRVTLWVSVGEEEAI
jgi:hypothetical protein